MSKVSRGFFIGLLLLVVATVGGYLYIINTGPPTETLRETITKEVGIDVTMADVQKEVAEIGIDRAIFAQLAFTADDAAAVERAIAEQDEWQPLPMPLHLRATHQKVLVGDTVYDYAPLRDEDNEPVQIPEVQEGHYYLRELRPTEPDQKEIEDLGGSIPKEYVMALYDRQEKLMYYYYQTM